MHILRRLLPVLVNLEHIRRPLNIRMLLIGHWQLKGKLTTFTTGCLEKGPQDYFKWPEISWYTLGVQTKTRTRQEFSI
jgi:hypothetical protein